jgi:hypothetical protein
MRSEQMGSGQGTYLYLLEKLLNSPIFKPHKSYLRDFDSWMSECSTEYNVPKSTLASILIDCGILTELNERE